MSIYGFTVKDMLDQNRFTEAGLQDVKDWARSQPEFPKFTDETLALFYMACENNIEATKRCARSYYKVKKDGPELFNNLDYTRDDIQHQLRVLNFAIMPQRTDEGYVVLIHRLVDTDYSQYNIETAMQAFFMTTDSAVYDNPPKGIVTLFDTQGVGLRHLTRIKMDAVKKFLFYMQEALPLKLRAIHIINVVWFFDKIFKLFRPFINDEVLQYLHLHTTGINMDEFYEKWIPKKCLPSDYGGDLDSVDELQKLTEQKMVEMKNYFIQEEMIRTAN